jgi:SAM-dependent methyltransferase
MRRDEGCPPPEAQRLRHRPRTWEHAPLEIAMASRLLASRSVLALSIIQLANGLGGAAVGGARPGRHGRNGWGEYWEVLSDDQRLFREQADAYVRNLVAALPPAPGANVLDFGCGFGHVARGLAPLVGQLCLWDYSENMRRRARSTVDTFSNVTFIDLAGGRPPEATLQFDLILVNSVIQYMTSEEFVAWLPIWRDMLAPGGRIVISDIIPPDSSGFGEILAIVKLSARRGFLFEALWQAVGELSSYWRKRRECPLTRYGPDDLARIAAGAGLTVERHPTNLTHFSRRLTAIFTHVA